VDGNVELGLAGEVIMAVTVRGHPKEQISTRQ
jgi:hypothetical protein